MKVIESDESLYSKLVETGAEPSFIKAFLNSDFLVIEEKDDKIIGVAGVGGIFHVGVIFVVKEHRGKGLGEELNLVRDNQVRERRYSFFIGTTYHKNPTAKPISYLLQKRKARAVFSFNYYEGFITTLFIQEFNWKGKILGKFLDFFNIKFGTFCMAVILKLTKKIWNQMFLVESTKSPKINICYSVKNFQKIS